MTATAAQYAAGLRQLADMIDAHPEIRISYLGRVHVWCPRSLDEIQAIIRAGKASGGRVDKEYSPEMANIGVSFGPVSAMALVDRAQVCERVVVGTTTELVPDPNHIPAATPMIERTVEVTEWRCHPVMQQVAP